MMNKPDSPIPVLILRAGHHGGLGAARSLGRLGIPVFALDSLAKAPTFRSRYCTESFVWDLEAAPPEESVKKLVDIAQRIGQKAVLIPTADTAVLFLAANATELRPWFRFRTVPFDIAQRLYSKEAMHSLARSAGIPTPDSFFPKSSHDLLDFAGRAKYPIMLKAIEERLTRTPGVSSKVIVRDREELLKHCSMLQQPGQPNVLLQEYIPGGDDASWMFNGYFDENSECLFGLTGRKIRQHPAYAGITSLGLCEHNQTVHETTRAFMKAIGYQGILDIGFRYDARDGKYKVFDVNPRIGCTFRLFVSDTGMDVARALYFDLTGRTINAGNAIAGRKWMAEDIDLASSYRYWADGKLSFGAWLRSLCGIRETAFFSRDDPRPLISRCAHDVGAILRQFRARKRPAELPPPAAPSPHVETSMEYFSPAPSGTQETPK